MGSALKVFCFALLVLSEVFAGRSKEKCLEYSKKFQEKLTESHMSGPPSTLGKVPTKPGEFPHMVALGFNGPSGVEWLCGGSLIDENFVLTSSICTKGPHGPVNMVRVGEYNIESSEDDADVQQIDVVEIKAHPEFKPPSIYNDIAVLRLATPVKLSAKIRPACLYDSNEWPKGRSVSATGWGKTNFGALSSPTLSKVYLDYFTHDECNAVYAGTTERRLPQNIIDKMHICAGGRDKPKDTCKGDAGGPLHYLDEKLNSYVLMGISSFGKSCGVIGIPSVYTRVYNYLPWIESIVWP